MATQQGLRISTRYATVEQFVAAFHRYCDERSIFISTPTTRPVGLKTAFSVDLVDGSPALRGRGIVLDAWTTAQNPFGRPGVHLGVRRLTEDSERVFARLLVAKATPAAVPTLSRTKTVRATPPPMATPLPTDLEAPALTSAVTPARDFELDLSTSPLARVADEPLEGFVDSTFFEETAATLPIVGSSTEDPADPAIPPPPSPPVTFAQPAVVAPSVAPPLSPPVTFAQPEVGAPSVAPSEEPAALDQASIVEPLSSPAAHAPPRAAEIATPSARGSRRWYFVGAFACVAVATAAVAIVIARSSAVSDHDGNAPASGRRDPGNHVVDTNDHVSVTAPVQAAAIAPSIDAPAALPSADASVAALDTNIDAGVGARDHVVAMGGAALPDAGVAEAHADVAVAHGDAGKHAGATLTPADGTVDKTKAALGLMNKAHDALQEADYERAVKLADSSLKLRKTTGTYVVKAQALQRLSRVDEALKALDGAIAIASKYAPAWELRSTMLWSAGRREEARSAMTRYLEIDPNGKSAPSMRKRLLE